MANQDGKTESDRAPYSFAEIRFGCKTMRLVIESVTNRLSAEARNCEAVSDLLNRMMSWTGKEEAARSLAKLLSDNDPATRAHAASAIVALRQVRETPDELRDAFTTEILKACDDPDARVREYAIRTLGWYASSDPGTASKALQAVVRAFQDEAESARLAALDVITDFGVARASSKLKELVGCLKDQSQQVRERVCEVLGWLERDAISAIDQLKSCAATDNDESVRRAAARAIMKIDPSGTRVDYGPQDQALRNAFLEVLREIGDDANPLRWELEEKWSKDSSKPAADWSREIPPGTESVFPELTPKERQIVQTIYKLRQDDGVEIGKVGKAVSWIESQNIRGSLDAHICSIRKKFKRKNLRDPFKRGKGKVSWVMQ